MNHKSMGRVEVKDEARGEVRAVFSTLNVIDSDRDVTRPGAFEDGAPVVISAYGHTSWEGMLPVGMGVIRANQTEAILEGQFFLDTTHGADTFKTVKHLGALGQWSYGFDVLKESYGDFEGQRVRFLEKLRVHEVSPVLRGAGVHTRTLAAKSAGPRDGLDEATREWLRRLHLKNLHELTTDALRREYGRVLAEAERNITTWYVEVDADDVPAARRAVAQAAIADACIDLRHSPLPSLRWFRRESQAEGDYLEVYGEVARPGFGWRSDRLEGKANRLRNEVWLNVELRDPELIAKVAGHEVRHLTGGDEAAAQAYEAVARARFWDRREDAR